MVLALASNGLHTNGYSLVRMLMDRMPEIKLEKVEGETFIEQIMKPHTPYYKALKGILGKDCIHGMAHITGGGIEGNLCRVIPDGLSAVIDLDKIKTLPVFRFIRQCGNISDREMLSTFNCGVGFIMVVQAEAAAQIAAHMNNYCECYEIGRIRTGEQKVVTARVPFGM